MGKGCKVLGIWKFLFQGTQVRNLAYGPNLTLNGRSWPSRGLKLMSPVIKACGFSCIQNMLTPNYQPGSI